MNRTNLNEYNLIVINDNTYWFRKDMFIWYISEHENCMIDLKSEWNFCPLCGRKIEWDVTVR